MNHQSLQTVVRWSAWRFLYGMLVVLSAHAAAVPNSSIDPEFIKLQQQLTNLNFQILIAPPPQRGAYGSFNPGSRTIWIHPLTFELGIASPVLVHEAVHAAQSCKGNDKLVALELTIEPLIYARPFWMRYENGHRQDLEREAFAIQTQPNRFELVESLLKSHCQKK